MRRLLPVWCIFWSCWRLNITLQCFLLPQTLMKTLGMLPFDIFWAIQKHLSLLSFNFVYCTTSSRHLFFSEINGELMIPLFPCCARRGGGWDSFFNRPTSRNWLEQQKYAQSPSARPHNGGADFFDRVLCCQGASWNYKWINNFKQG